MLHKHPEKFAARLGFALLYLKAQVGHKFFYRKVFSHWVQAQKIPEWEDLENLILYKALSAAQKKELRSYAQAQEEFWFGLKPTEGDVRIIFYFDNYYPQSLKTLADPPLAIFIRGAWPQALAQGAVGIVGSRQPKFFEYKDIQHFCRPLFELKQKTLIISGGAQGIDAWAHRVALEAKSPTVAVLAHGLDHVYPPTHYDLYEKIVQAGGCLLSEYELGVPPLKQHFVARNRLIAALSDWLVLFQAKPGSGSLITAQFALELGKNVAVCPAGFASPEQWGGFDLVNQGARLLWELPSGQLT